MKTIALTSLLALVACAPASPPAPDAPPATLPASGEDACGAGNVQNLLGKSAADTAADAKVRSGADRVRTYRTGDPVTMDFSPTRLNVETDAGGRIVRLSCG